MNDSKQTATPARLPRLPAPSAAALSIGAAVGVMASAVLWSYWTTLQQLAETWWIDSQYSHGFLVPVFAAVILWLKKPTELKWQPSAWGLVVLVVSIAPRWFTARMDLAHVDGACMIGSLCGVVLLVGGVDVFKWSWPAILFLGFMLPLPHSIEQGIAIPLRTLATNVSTYVLQTFGYPALAEGNIIHIEEIRLGVIDACSGLGMLMMFLAEATAMALILPKPIADRVVLVISAIPIAVFANVLRITLTGMAYASLGWQEYRGAIHDTLGYMMPFWALFLLWMELKFLRVLLISTGDEAPLSVPLSPWVERAKPKKSKPRWS